MDRQISTSRRLRILIVVDLPWDVRLGACRVWMELAKQWRAMGHSVEQFSFSEAFPGVRATGYSFSLQRIAFVRKAAAFVRANGHRFDIIDALIGALPFSREELGFGGAIVARSVGLYRLYGRFEESVWRRWPRLRRGSFAGRLFYRYVRHRLWRASETTVRKADLVNVPNAEEAACLRDESGVTSAIVVQPYGLTQESRRALETAACGPAHRLAQKRVCFIGMWSARKGAHDWEKIIGRVRAQVPAVQFRFLGTMAEAGAVRSDLGAGAAEGVELITDYKFDELPALLSDCTVGAFPSYVEGFGLAVLEQLAAGLPTVSYNISGPRDLLEQRLPQLLVPKGDIERFAAALCDILLASPPAYAQLSRQSAEATTRFSWSEIARDTLGAYETLLADGHHEMKNATPARLNISENPRAAGKRSVICTLYEGDYHLGLGALVNSLHARGFRGDFHAGFRGELPPWSSERARKVETGWLFEVGEDSTLHFVPLCTKQHFNNHKPTFVLHLMECYPEVQNFFFFDPDIVVRADWDFFERWVSRGIAVCEDVNNYMPRHHPVRQAWKEYAQKNGLTIRQEPDKYYNAGFFAVRREDESFLERWQQLFACRVADGADLSDFALSDFVYPYMATDQDLMNLALMLVDRPLTAVGPEGMGFRPGGYVMSHAAGEIKSWRKRFVWEALKARAPTAMDKEFVQHTQSPIKICSHAQLTWKRIGVTVGSAIGRFYRRAGA